MTKISPQLDPSLWAQQMMTIYKIRKTSFAARVRMRKNNYPKVSLNIDYFLHLPNYVVRKISNALISLRPKVSYIDWKKNTYTSRRMFCQKVDVLEIIRNKQFHHSYSIFCQEQTFFLDHQKFRKMGPKAQEFFDISWWFNAQFD